MFSLFRRKFDVEAYVAASVEGLQLATDAHRGIWHLGEEESWNVDQERGELVLAFTDGSTASAPVQIVGTLSTRDGTFLWGWDHPSVARPLQADAARCRAFGEEHGAKEFTTQKVSCTETRAWAYAALAMRLAGASGAYRGEAAPGTYVFMTFGEVQLSRAG